MPIGTASHRPRKMVMLQLLRELNRNSCLWCKEKIEDPEDLTIDHKLPWLDESRELFWDLSNIGFSHTFCNAIARRSTAGRKFGPNIRRKVGPSGTAWCTGHAQFVPLGAFCRSRAKWAGVQSFCKSCRAQRYPNSRYSARDLAFDQQSGERVGFEPTERSSRSAVFKTAAFNRSATSPSPRKCWPGTAGTPSCWFDSRWRYQSVAIRHRNASYASICGRSRSGGVV
jgi:hypothetical protein